MNNRAGKISGMLIVGEVCLLVVSFSASAGLQKEPCQPLDERRTPVRRRTWISPEMQRRTTNGYVATQRIPRRGAIAKVPAEGIVFGLS